MTKILVTNNEYQEILKKEADLFWKKTFKKSDNGITGKALENLKKQYWQEMEENLRRYEIEKFNPQLKNKALNNFIENYCTSNKEKENHVRYEGHFPGSYLNIEGCKRNFDTGYSQYLSCDDDLTIVEYCEGDITVLTFKNQEAYKDQLKKAEEFYQNY